MILLEAPLRHRGTVASFDADRGYGTIAVAGGPTVGFHCVAVADGSRMIDVGAAVVCDLFRGLGGTIEARNISR